LLGSAEFLKGTRLMSKWLFAITLTVGVSLPLAAQQHWPNWRGPSASGVATGANLPVTWTDTQNVAWKAPIRGVGISSPIVWGDLVVVTSQIGTGESRTGPRLVQGGNPLDEGERALTGATPGDGRVTFLVSAFDRASGRKSWEFEQPAEGPLPFVHEKHNLASPSPATDGERVYAWFATGQIAAVDLRGNLVWKRNIAADYNRPFQINWGHGSSPVVFRDTLYLLCYHENGSFLLALDARTGAVRWKVDADPGVVSYSTPLAMAVGDRVEVIVNSSTGMNGHDGATGRRLWHVPEANRFPVPTPFAHDGVIYASRGYRSSPFLAIRPGGSGDVSASHVIWRVPSGGPYISSLVQYDGLIYMMGDVGVLTVTDAKTGERVFQERLGGVYTASPVAADGKIYLSSEDGEVIVLAAGRTPRVLARNTLSARLLASPAIANGRLFFRADNALIAVGQ
jgi:outer membrane protein assembly factor BamB